MSLCRSLVEKSRIGQWKTNHWTIPKIRFKKYKLNPPQAQVETLAPGWVESATRRGDLRQFVEGSPGLIVFVFLICAEIFSFCNLQRSCQARNIRTSKIIAKGLLGLDSSYIKLIVTTLKLEGKWGSRYWRGLEDLHNLMGFKSFLNLSLLAKCYWCFPKNTSYKLKLINERNTAS